MTMATGSEGTLPAEARACPAGRRRGSGVNRSRRTGKEIGCASWDTKVAQGTTVVSLGPRPSRAVRGLPGDWFFCGSMGQGRG